MFLIQCNLGSLPAAITHLDIFTSLLFFFLKKYMHLVTCSWLFIRHHLSTVCMLLPPQL